MSGILRKFGFLQGSFSSCFRQVEPKKLIRIKDQHVDWDVVRRLEVKGNIIIVHFENEQTLPIELESPKAVWKELGNIANQFGYTAPPPKKMV